MSRRKLFMESNAEAAEIRKRTIAEKIQGSSCGQRGGKKAGNRETNCVNKERPEVMPSGIFEKCDNFRPFSPPQPIVDSRLVDIFEPAMVR